jgi:hypothetical protein
MPDPTTKTVSLRQQQPLVLRAKLPKYARPEEAQRAADALAYLLGVTITVEEA